MPDPRIIVLLMVKNEFRIIVRSIMSTLKIADAVCVSDTGSTDDTLKVLDAYFPTLSVPAKYYQHSWTNFGVNRTQSFQDAVDFGRSLGWDLANTYALAVDADMVLQVEPTFKKAELTKRGYSLIQKAGTLHYANCRLMRLDQPWRCVGATHEYWDGPNEGGTFDATKLWIDDRNDGGCKADKFQRDERLLLAELAEQPTNVRTHFYLAQTYKCLGNTEKAIEFYKKRIALGGWWEEVWYSHYMIAKMHLEAKRPEKAELWVLRAQKCSNYRAEALYLLVRHFRIEGQQWKAMHYLREAKKIPKPAVALFLESEVYDHLLDYENTILQYYTNSNKKEGLMACIRYALHPQSGGYLDNVFSNLQFYTAPLAADATPLQVPDTTLSVFKPSSTSLAFHDGRWIANVRYVNYETSRQGAYRSRDADGIVRTINGYMPSLDALTAPAPASPGLATLVATSSPSSPLFVDSPSGALAGLSSHPTNVMGLEDLRLFSHRGALYYTAASKEHNAENKVRMVMGRYDPTSTPALTENRCLLPPTPTDCEKNWLTIGDHPSSPDPLFVYKWHPFQFGTIDASTNTLQIRSTINTPPYFQKVRGSANPVLMPDGKEYLAVVHTVKYETPRKYYHHVVALDATTLTPTRISAPFYFETHGIEYCIGFAITTDTSSAAASPTLLFVYSTFDAEPKLVRLPLSAFDFVSI